MEVETAPVARMEEELEVVGSVVSYNRGAGFLQFSLDGADEVCLFRPNKLVVDGQKVPAGKIKTFEGLSKYLSLEDTLTAVVSLATDLKSYKVFNSKGEELEMTPRWYSNYIWKGERPSNQSRMSGPEASENAAVSKGEQEIIIDNVPGRIIVNALASGTGRRSVGQTLISFKNPEGQQDIAMFRLPKLFFVNGRRIQQKEYSHWTQDYEVDVKFTAVYTPGLKGYVRPLSENDNGEILGEASYKPNWRAKLVWIGDKPTEEMLVEEVVEVNKKSDGVLDSLQGCEYMTARVEKILNKNQGIITLRKNHVMFHIEKLSVDGQHYTTQDNLNNILQLGETLFCYAKPVSPPSKVDGFEINYEAAQVWKGRKVFAFNKDGPAGEEEKAQTKSSIPLPSEATHRDLVGSVQQLETVSLGYLVIKSDDPSLRGQKVLFSKNRLFINGTKLRYKDTLESYLSIGDIVNFDVVQANPEQSLSTYNWIAVLAWQGKPPDREEINAEMIKKTQSYRGKVLRLSETKGLGCTGGVVQIVGGPNKIGEMVVFCRNSTYIYGSSMKLADLSYVIKLNDKIQLEIAELLPSSDEYRSTMHKYQTEIKYTASLVWVGNFPKGDEVLDDLFYAGSIVTPFIQKRGLTLDSFLSLVKGQLPPKCSKSSPAPEEKVPSLPPNVTTGRVIELKRREASASHADPGVEHGIVKIDNGPFVNEKAFFHRSSLFCWGHNCSKADLMYLINDTDTVRLEVQGGTNNKAIPCKVTSAWIGPHKNEKNKESVAMSGNPVFVSWLSDHKITVDEFHRIIKGEMVPKTFFPLPGESHQARLGNLLYGPNGDADAGILRLCQNPANSKDGRKAPEVVFERESFYLWNIHISKGDLSYLMNESDKYFVEVTDLVGKEKRKWQTRLGTDNIPKFIATMVYVGGGRPKLERLSDDISSNCNLVQWLKKRDLESSLFRGLVAGSLPPKKDEDVFSSAYQMGNGKEKSPFNNPGQSRRPPSFNQPSTTPEHRAGILNKALNLTQRTMTLATPEDPDVQNLIQDDADAQLALFLSKTLTNAIMMFRQGGPGPIGPPTGKPGPIGPPRGGGRRGELNEFYADNMNRGVSGRSEGLYGLSKPLLDYQGNGSLEPPYKRKYEDW